MNRAVKLLAAKPRSAAELRERLAALGAEPLGTTPQELDAFMRAQVEKMAKAVKESGARPDA